MATALPQGRRRAGPCRALAPPLGRVGGAAPGRAAAPGRPAARLTCDDARVNLPVMPPVLPMLARSVKELPTGDLSFEPKWDGFRSIVFRDGDEVEIGSRNTKPMTRYFPEVVEAILANVPERCVLDGEIVVIGASGD